MESSGPDLGAMGRHDGVRTIAFGEETRKWREWFTHFVGALSSGRENMMSTRRVLVAAGMLAVLGLVGPAMAVPVPFSDGSFFFEDFDGPGGTFNPKNASTSSYSSAYPDSAHLDKRFIFNRCRLWNIFQFNYFRSLINQCFHTILL